MSGRAAPCHLPVCHLCIGAFIAAVSFSFCCAGTGGGVSTYVCLLSSGTVWGCRAKVRCRFGCCWLQVCSGTLRVSMHWARSAMHQHHAKVLDSQGTQLRCHFIRVAQALAVVERHMHTKPLQGCRFVSCLVAHDVALCLPVGV
jgi:hypothetical protein